MSTDKRSTRRVSRADVAQLAGVSPQTVSRVSNGEPHVTPGKRERVLAAMKQLGYRPNAAARAMKSGEFKTLGVIFQDLHSVGTHRSVEAITEAAANSGYVTVLIPLDASVTRDTDGAFTRMGEMTVDAVIAILPSHLRAADDMHLPPGVPMIVLGASEDPEASVVDFDQAHGVRQALEHLVSLGHRRIHHIAGPMDSTAACSREQTWREFLTEHSLEAPPVQRGNWTPDSGYWATREILAQERPRAIFAANDQMALGAYRAVLEAGMCIPGDVSIVGVDDIDEAVAFPPPLTTVSQDWMQVGRDAVDLALGMLRGEASRVVLLPTELVIRASTGPAPVENWP